MTAQRWHRWYMADDDMMPTRPGRQVAFSLPADINAEVEMAAADQPYWRVIFTFPSGGQCAVYVPNPGAAVAAIEAAGVMVEALLERDKKAAVLEA